LNDVQETLKKATTTATSTFTSMKISTVKKCKKTVGSDPISSERVDSYEPVL
jgi:hypothetical protein